MEKIDPVSGRPLINPSRRMVEDADLTEAAARNAIPLPTSSTSGRVLGASCPPPQGMPTERIKRAANNCLGIHHTKPHR